MNERCYWLAVLVCGLLAGACETAQHATTPQRSEFANGSSEPCTRALPGASSNEDASNENAANEGAPNEDASNENGEEEDADDIAYCMERIEVVQGRCEMNPVPASMRESLSGERYASFEAMLTTILNHPYARFRVDGERGLLVVSEQARHECRAWRFAVAATQEMKQWGGEWSSPITCDGNVCCLPAVDDGMTSSGMVFEEVDGEWVLSATYAFPYEETLSDEADAARLRRRIVDAERRRRRCR